MRRANPDWASKLGYDGDELSTANRESVTLVEALRGESSRELVISGCIGPHAIVEDQRSFNAPVGEEQSSIQLR